MNAGLNGYVCRNASMSAPVRASPPSSVSQTSRRTFVVASNAASSTALAFTLAD